MLPQISIDYQTLYTNNFKRQKVQLVINEKTIACLRRHGRHETEHFVELVTRMRKILNIKSPAVGRNLNDGDREKCITTDDPRLEFLLKMGH